MDVFRIFFGALRRYGWPRPRVFAHGLVPLLVWHLLDMFWPSVSDEVRLSWAVLFYLSFGFWLNIPSAYSKLGKPTDRQNKTRIVIVCSAIWLAIAGFVFASQEFGWVQHFMTIVLLTTALVEIVEGIIRTGRFGGRTWSEEERASHRPTFAAVNFLYCAGLAILNETFIKHLSLDAWVVWLSLVPLAMWILTRAITVTVLMSHNSDEI